MEVTKNSMRSQNFHNYFKENEAGDKLSNGSSVSAKKQPSKSSLTFKHYTKDKFMEEKVKMTKLLAKDKSREKRRGAKVED